VASPPNDATRLFVVEQTGRIRVLVNDVLQTTPFIDLSGAISYSPGGERGLLSIAFRPDYVSSRRFYVYFTNPAGDIRIVRYLASATNPNVADVSTADTVIQIAHPTYDNHNGGQLQFGPDGMLYAGTGDGGSGGDPDGNGQNKKVLLGKLLRLDVNVATGYAIPPTNPFANDPNAAPEIWSYGLRNPWRFSFDKATHDLYIADVGQAAWEEVDVATAMTGLGRGADYGWNIMEGTHCYKPATGCNQAGLVLPVLEYDHSGGACSITGGYVYRGTRVPALAGRYLYSDYCAGFVKSFTFAGGVATDPKDWSAQLSPGPEVSSFGEDANGDVYIMTLTGKLYRIVQS
jgi:glucose/arabinose dehydrogenase